MSIELKVPDVGESIQEVQIRKWRKQVGDQIEEDEDLVELETDKASVELPAPVTGTIQKILVDEGETAQIGDVLAIMEEGKLEANQGKSEKTKSTKDSSTKSENGHSKKKSKKKRDKQKKSQQETVSKSKNQSERTKTNGNGKQSAKEKETGAKDEVEELSQTTTELIDDQNQSDTFSDAIQSTPAARREMRRHNISATEITPRGDRIRPEDVRRYVESQDQERDSELKPSSEPHTEVSEEVVPMSFLRQKIAERLVESQQNSALLTTFNEIDMSTIIRLRKERGEAFAQRYQVKLGFMSFFVKATVEALKQQPMVNAQVRDGDKIAYFKNYHIGIAIGSSRGLVVPVLRNADQMSFADIEHAIDSFANAAEEETLQPADLQGGTFTISNGGIYGSLLSTPIVNPPQSGVLGMHQIQDRAVVREQEIVIRPMMYVALSYDHRIIDGKEAVTFLRGIKEAIEDPVRMLLDI